MVERSRRILSYTIEYSPATLAALIMLENTDFETVALSTDSEFLELIRSSRVRQAQEGGLSSAQVRRHLEIEVTSPRHSR